MELGQPVVGVAYRWARWPELSSFIVTAIVANFVFYVYETGEPAYYPIDSWGLDGPTAVAVAEAA